MLTSTDDTNDRSLIFVTDKKTCIWLSVDKDFFRKSKHGHGSFDMECIIHTNTCEKTRRQSYPSESVNLI